MSTRASGGDPPPGPGQVALVRSPGFWVIVRYAILFGVVLAFAALAFLALVKFGTNLWFTLPDDLGWFGGSPWWVVVTAGAGLLVGVLRHVLRVPESVPGTVVEIQAGRVEPSTVPGDGRRLAGVAQWRGEPRARGRTGKDRRRAGDLGLRAAEAQRGPPRNEHAQWDVRGLRRPAVVSDPGVDPHPRDRATVRRPLRRYAGRRSAGRLGRVRRVLPDRRARRSSGSTRCRPTSTRTGTCSRPFPSASPPVCSRWSPSSRSGS